MAYIELIQNLALLVALAVVYDTLGLYRYPDSISRRVAAGALFGAAAVVSMLSSVDLGSGVIYDGRSTVVAVAGIFTGVPGGVTAAAIAVTYRIVVGGGGAPAGVAGIVLAAAMSTPLFYLRRRNRQWRSPLVILALGVALHAMILLLQWLLLPSAVARNLIRSIWVTELLLFPVILLLISLVFLGREERTIAVRQRRHSEQMYRNLFENTHSVMLLIRPSDHTIVDASPAAARFYGWSREELCSMKISQINTLNEESVKRELERARREQSARFNFRHRLADGSVREVEVTSGEVDLDGQRLLHSVVRDVTARNEAERQIETALEEKEALLKEVHHRVKNNLAVLASLINLQAERDGEQTEALLNTRDRINAIAEVHNTLYREGDLARVDLRAYLKELVDNLATLYNDERNIDISLEAQKVELEIADAVPLALIMSELVTNAYKHAFPKGRDGHVRVFAEVEGESFLLLRVSDNGVGYTQDIDDLGLQLVELLTEQVDGKLRRLDTSGTSIELRVPCRG